MRGRAVAVVERGATLTNGDDLVDLEAVWMAGGQAYIYWLAAQVADRPAASLGYQPGLDARPRPAVAPPGVGAGAASHWPRWTPVQ